DCSGTSSRVRYRPNLTSWAGSSSPSSCASTRNWTTRWSSSGWPTASKSGRGWSGSASDLRPSATAQSSPNTWRDRMSADLCEDAHHTTVLLDEVLDYLRPRGGVGFRALDCTVGAGGHSFGLLERSSPDGRLVGLDADPYALELAVAALAPFQSRFSLLDRNFSELAELDLEPMHAIVFGLGLSSMQLESSGRGFSFRLDEPLDMRFDPRSERRTAAELLNTLPEAELERVLREYGEEPRARRVARIIAQRRQTRAFQRTGDLVAAVTAALGGARGRIHPAT